ncbi:MAG: CDP-diacylglycerol--glycerol-3-phosphate 3-phosphatidyltransferase [bacterium]
MNLAIIITISRIFLSFIFLGFNLIETYWADVVSFYIFLTAAITDLLDGYVARLTGRITNLGKFMDPLADKILVSVGLIGITGRGLIGNWVVMLIVGRELFITGIRSISAYKGVVIQPIPLAKAKTFFQMAVVFIYLLSITYPLFYRYITKSVSKFLNLNIEHLVYYLLVFTVFITIITGVIYIWRNKKVIMGMLY